LDGSAGPHRFVLEKWYLDVLAPDGTVLLVYLGWLRLLGLGLARVLRAPLRRLARDPHEVKWACEAALAGSRAVAILERVGWP
jgi:hypothetical protein